MFLVIGVLKICSKLTGEHPCRSVISIKLPCNFIEITLRHGSSPVNLLHIFKRPFPKNTSGRLLLSETSVWECLQSRSCWVWRRQRITIWRAAMFWICRERLGLHINLQTTDRMGPTFFKHCLACTGFNHFLLF